MATATDERRLVQMHNEDQLDAALRRLARSARARYRAGEITLAECARITRAVIETIGGAP